MHGRQGFTQLQMVPSFLFPLPFLMMLKCVAFFSCCFTGSHVTSTAAVFSLGILLSHLEQGYGVKAEVDNFHSYSNKGQKEDL